jgi:hypothetical protein
VDRQNSGSGGGRSSVSMTRETDCVCLSV